MTAKKLTLPEYCRWLEKLTARGETIDAYGLQIWIEEYHQAKSKEEAEERVEMVKKFHEVFHLPSRDIPIIIPEHEFSLRHKILNEETAEIYMAYYEGNLTEVFDGIIDSLYVLLGTAVQMGFGDILHEGFKEVHRSNMSKLNKEGKPILREDGKVMKGRNFSPPDLKTILAAFGKEGEG